MYTVCTTQCYAQKYGSCQIDAPSLTPNCLMFQTQHNFKIMFIEHPPCFTKSWEFSHLFSSTFIITRARTDYIPHATISSCYRFEQSYLRVPPAIIFNFFFSNEYFFQCQVSNIEIIITTKWFSQYKYIYFLNHFCL